MMKPEEKAAWVAALRSGDYRQGRNALYSRMFDAFCCLGVKCAIDGIAYRDELACRIFDFEGHPSPSSNATFPTDETLKSWGLSPAEAQILADMNDEGILFAVIADYIENNPLI